MTYGLNTGAFIENGPTEASAAFRSSLSTARSWRALDASRRLHLVERALKPANDLVDAYPLAL